MIDQISINNYKKVCEKYFGLWKTFSEFVDYEEKIANGLTGMVYILISENHQFSFKNHSIIIKGYKIKEYNGQLIAIKEKETIKGFPLDIYTKIFS